MQKIWGRGKVRNHVLLNTAANLMFVCIEHTYFLSPVEQVLFFSKMYFLNQKNVKFMRAELCLAWTLSINVSGNHSSPDTTR